MKTSKRTGLALALAGAFLAGACSNAGHGPRTSAGGPQSDSGTVQHSRTGQPNDNRVRAGSGYWVQQCNLMTGNDRLSCLDLYGDRSGPQGRG